jgi:nucleotide-binding universal stress UspA family protein
MYSERVLVTTDFSADSERAFEQAAYLAKMDGSKVTLLTVVSDWEVPHNLYPYLAAPERIEEYRTYLVSEAERQLKKYKEKFHGQDIETKVIASIKPVAQEISDYARNNGMNLIIMSSHGRGALGNLFLGSVLQAVLKLAPCPVLVVPKH